MTHDGKTEFARRHGIPVPAAAPSPYSIDANLWGRSIQRGMLEDPWLEPPSEVFALTRDPSQCPDEPAYIELEFEGGVPVAVNGVAMPFMDVIASVGTIAGAHGVGRIDAIEHGPAGITSRAIHEAPAAAVLHVAHRELERLASPSDLLRTKQEMALRYADLVYEGAWHSPVREAMDAFIAKTQERVTGIVRVRLFKGSAQVVARTREMADLPATLEKAV
jgi:argininosuccinate synthase